jgi:hypothetical protein
MLMRENVCGAGLFIFWALALPHAGSKQVRVSPGIYKRGKPKRMRLRKAGFMPASVQTTEFPSLYILCAKRRDSGATPPPTQPVSESHSTE